MTPTASPYVTVSTRCPSWCELSPHFDFDQLADGSGWVRHHEGALPLPAGLPTAVSGFLLREEFVTLTDDDGAVFDPLAPRVVLMVEDVTAFDAAALKAFGVLVESAQIALATALAEAEAER